MTDKELNEAGKMAYNLYYQYDDLYRKEKPYIKSSFCNRHQIIEVCTMTHKLLKHINSLQTVIEKLELERLELIHAILPVEENP